MRLSLPTARQNEVQRGWRRAGRLLGKLGNGRPKTRFTGQVWRTTGPSGVRAAWSSARADEARNEVHRAEAGARERLGRARQRTETRFKRAREDWAGAGGRTCGRGSNWRAGTPGARGQTRFSSPKLLEALGERARGGRNEVQAHAGAGRARAASPPKRGSPALAARQNEVPRQKSVNPPIFEFWPPKPLQVGMKAINRGFWPSFGQPMVSTCSQAISKLPNEQKCKFISSSREAISSNVIGSTLNAEVMEEENVFDNSNINQLLTALLVELYIVMFAKNMITSVSQN
ncbi:hypothetical protein GH714_037894 [Hevea brasiliensis]|uniref:Uncharacterized protein n=1 Tax=Hevea brasiliensis TaxID=3981 RepID=A0A6A6LR38_HEVBR|nr:hypothetical protein GH714_037894 [Hevea brasiliensis]